jgi:hypothetical protein
LNTNLRNEAVSYVRTAINLCPDFFGLKNSDRKMPTYKIDASRHFPIKYRLIDLFLNGQILKIFESL